MLNIKKGNQTLEKNRFFSGGGRGGVGPGHRGVLNDSNPLFVHRAVLKTYFDCEIIAF